MCHGFCCVHFQLTVICLLTQWKEVGMMTFVLLSWQNKTLYLLEGKGWCLYFLTMDQMMWEPPLSSLQVAHWMEPKLCLSLLPIVGREMTHLLVPRTRVSNTKEQTQQPPISNLETACPYSSFLALIWRKGLEGANPLFKCTQGPWALEAISDFAANDKGMFSYPKPTDYYQELWRKMINLDLQCL